jgi:hypothetical protein
VDGQITAIYSLCEDVLKTLHHSEDPQCRMSDAEVMTTAIVAALYFGGNRGHGSCWDSPLTFPGCSLKAASIGGCMPSPGC